MSNERFVDSQTVCEAILRIIKDSNYNDWIHKPHDWIHKETSIRLFMFDVHGSQCMASLTNKGCVEWVPNDTQRRHVVEAYDDLVTKYTNARNNKSRTQLYDAASLYLRRKDGEIVP